MRLPVAFDGQVAGSVVVTAVERQELSLFAFEPCGHPHLIRIHREVDERALLEGEKEIPSVALCLILLDGIARALTGERVLQLSGDDRQPVHGEYDVDDASPVLSMCILQRRCECHLPGNAKTILSITRGGL